MYTTRDADDFDEYTVEELMTGTYHGQRDDLRVLAGYLAVTREEFTTLPVPPPNSEVAQILRTGLQPRRARRAAQRASARRALRRRGVLTGTSTLLTTLAGKALFGAVAVAAGVGGAHATGVVDVPGLPERTVVEAPGGADDRSVPGVEREPAHDGGHVVVVEITPDAVPTEEPTEDRRASVPEEVSEADEKESKTWKKRTKRTWSWSDWSDSRDGRDYRHGR